MEQKTRSEVAILQVVAEPKVATAILNGLTEAYKQADDKTDKEMYRNSIGQVLTAIEANGFTVSNEPFKTYAELIHFQAKN